MMKKLLMLGTSKGSCEMIRIAKAKGVYTIVTDYLSPDVSVATFALVGNYIFFGHYAHGFKENV